MGASARGSFAHPTLLARPRSIRVVHGVGGADLVQQGRWQFADLGHEPLQLFARQRRNADVDPLGFGEQFGVLHGGVKRAPQCGEAIGGDAGRGEKGGADLGRIHERAEEWPLPVGAGWLDGRGAVRRSAGTPCVVKKAVPTSVAFMTALRIARSSSLRASSTAVGMSESSACRLSANCTRIATLASRNQSGWATLSAVHEVE